MVETRPPRNGEQPRRKGPATVVPVQVSIGAEERLLGQILGVGRKALPPQEVQQRGLESPQQQIEAG